MSDKNEKKTIEINWNGKEARQLVDALLSLKNAGEAKIFMRDLMTPQEINEFGNRLEAARLLSRDAQYSSISDKTGLSSTTIARIAKWLKGPLGGYRLVLNRIPARNTSAGGHHTHIHAPAGKGLSLYS